MKNILGLDLGTTSIGFAHVVEGEKTEQSSIVKIGVRVNPLTTDEQTNFEKGRPISINADRTLKRGARRALDRYQLRRENLIEVLKQSDIITNESKLRKHWGVTRVPTRRLDSFNFSTVDLIKIDVEGHEHQVVNGALKTIQRCRPAIVVEISYEGKLLDHVLSADHKKTVGLIESLGYQTVWQHKHDWLLLPDDWYSR